MTPESDYPRGKTLSSGPRALPNGQRAHLETLTWQDNMETSARLAKENGTTALEEFVKRWIDCTDWAKEHPPIRPRGRTLKTFGPSDEQIAQNTSALAAQLSWV